ncbi:fungal-specific transcription factor domain-containing protein [Boeremia exigua]|uniref:fungal-specific transcription factor domain-containing protein n=1 Tax=Boeremia exigua TaxID=749465 RepID=UPI001E8D0446|nr:fungal-specific transcription factor domain-containing protein [Boeremia exigua]KAH6639898.1 fungal-specific transcription factor domain-containing protein [Boeremia exigua]
MADRSNCKRTFMACLHCQKRKQRCSGAMPSCDLCARLNLTCVYTERRRRGPGKKKEHVQILEDRLKRIEGRLRKQPPQLLVSEDEANGHDEPHSGRNSLGRSQGHDAIASVTNNLSDSRGRTRSDNTPVLSGTLNCANLVVPVQQVQADMDGSHVHRRMMTPLPAKHLTAELVQLLVEQSQLHRTLFTAKSLLSLLNQQYTAGSGNCVDDPSRWAVVNSFLASAMLQSTTCNSFQGIFPTAWTYFKNSFAVLPELVVQAAELSACEALLAMAMFMLASADARTTSQLIAAAARLAHGLGMQRRGYYLSTDPVESAQYRHIFWTVYILDVEMMHKYGLPSLLQNGDVHAELRKGEQIDGYCDRTSLDGQSSNGISQQRVRLAVIQSKIHTLLMSDKFMQKRSIDLLDDVAAMHQELQTWKNSLPEQMQPGGVSCENPLDMLLAFLHFTYYSSLARVHMAVARILEPDCSDSARDTNLEANQNYLSGKLARAMCAATARATIGVLRQLPLQPFSNLWGILCYPVSAALILLSTILADPAAHLAESDVGTIGEVIQFLERLQGDGNDVQKLLDGCLRLHQTAVCAVDAHKASEQNLVLGQVMPDDATRAQLESVRLKLLRVSDFLYLAQGLLSNISILRVEASLVLCDIIEPDLTDGVYGVFVPESLKSCTFNLLSTL